MNLRCKPGDIAMITWDYDDCIENLGRLVEVGQSPYVQDGKWVWRIRPITPELYSLQEVNGSIARESVTWASKVEHPDSWMVPLKPQQPDASTDETDGLDVRHEDCARIQVTN